MSLDLETRRNNFGLVQKAMRLRAKDYENESLSRREEDARLARLLKRSDVVTKPGVLTNQPVSSNQFREYLRDARFLVLVNNLQLNELETDIHHLAQRSLNRLEKLNHDVDALSSVTTEQELRIYKGYDVVHHNAFVRERDMMGSLLDNKWLVDYKTELSFDKTQVLNVIPAAGATLPIQDRIKTPFVNAWLVHEETDVGDTSSPILSTDPRYVFLPNKVFRHVIIRREHDETSRIYPRTQSFCTLLLELPGIQLVNFFSLVPASGTTVLVDNLSYINESNEEVDLTEVHLEGGVGLHFLFEPVRVRYIKVKLTQHCPITKLGRHHLDQETHQLNRLLEGVTWASRFDESSEYIEGRVFDFSIKDMQAGLNQYLTTGVFKSRPVSIQNPASCSISDRVELILLNGTEDEVLDALPDAGAFLEYYLGVDIKSSGGTRLLEDLIPLLDEYPNQVELLPLIGGEARVRLLPNLLSGLTTNRIVTVTSVAYPTLEVTTEASHGFVVGDDIGVLGPGSHNLVGDHVVTAITGATSFRTQDLNAHNSQLLVTQNTTPWLYVYLQDADLDTTTPPFRVYKNGDELFIGDDYQINLGTSQHWGSTFPKGKALTKVLEDPRSGKLRVLILDPSYEDTYWIEYVPLPNQYLGKTKLVQLINGRVVFDKRFRKSSGELVVVAVMRSNLVDPFSTPVLRSYDLVLRTH